MTDAYPPAPLLMAANREIVKATALNVPKIVITDLICEAARRAILQVQNSLCQVSYMSIHPNAGVTDPPTKLRLLATRICSIAQTEETHSCVQIASPALL
jgi:hypothetical protein